MDFDSNISELIREEIKFDFMLVDQVECTCGETSPVYVGHLLTNKLLKDYYIFKVSENKLLELYRVVSKLNPLTKFNFIVNGTEIVYPKCRQSQFISAEHSNKDILYKLDDCMEFTLFNLLALVEELDGYLEIDSSRFKVSDLRFSEKSMSMYYSEKKQTWRSVLLLSYNMGWELRNFNILLPDNVDKLLTDDLLEHLNSCTVKSQDTSNLISGYVRYSVDTELASICPVDMSWVPALFSQETLLTVLSELKYSKIFLTGVSMFSTLMKEYLDFNPVNDAERSSRKHRPLYSEVFRIKYDFCDYNTKPVLKFLLSEKLGLCEDIMNYYSEESEDVLNRIKDKLYRLSLDDMNYSLFVEGFMTALQASDFQYSSVIKACSDVRKQVYKKDIYKQLYYYLWRATFQDNKSLVETLFVRNPLTPQLSVYLGATVNGGVYNEEFTLL